MKDIDKWLEAVKAGANTEILIKPTGVSMLPLIRGKKDKVIVMPIKRELKLGDIILFRRFDGKNVLHRLYKIEGEKLITFGDGCYNPDRPITREDVFGIAVTLYKNHRKINLDSAFQRKIGHIFVSAYPLRRIYYRFRRIFRAIFRRIFR